MQTENVTTLGPFSAASIVRSLLGMRRDAPTLLRVFHMLGRDLFLADTTKLSRRAQESLKTAQTTTEAVEQLVALIVGVHPTQRNEGREAFPADIQTAYVFSARCTAALARELSFHTSAKGKKDLIAQNHELLAEVMELRAEIADLKGRPDAD